MKRLLSSILALALVLSLMIAGAVAVSAETGSVAKVGNTEYATIDEAIANWTNGTTLTLLADVTLSDVIVLKSTEHHILDLGTYTMTAASKKDAIQIENNARSSASYALDIKADATNPGGITATGKAVVRTAGKSGVKDRPIIRFYGGVFNASYIVYHSGSNGTNCPQFQFYGGEFNGTIYTNRALNQFYGGTFTGSLQMSVDSSAYTLVAGGTFKNLSNLYMSALNSSKFTIGSAKGVYDKEVYIDDNGNYVIAAAEPTQGIEAAVAKTPGTNDYLAYSKVATEGALNYTDVRVALEKNNTATSKVTIYVEELDMTGINYKGTIVVPEGQSLTITNAPEDLKVEGEGKVTIVKPVAKVGETEYNTLADAIAAAKDGDTINVLSDIELEKYLYVGQDKAKEVVIDLGGHTISSTGRVLIAYRAGTKLTVQNGTVVGGGSTGSLVANYNGTLILGENLTVKNDKGCAVYVNNGTLIAPNASVTVEGTKKAIDIKDGYVIQISAGSYNSVLSNSFCAEGYFPVKHADGTYGVSNGEASIGSYGYATLKDAIEAAKDGDIIKLRKDLNLTAADAVKTTDGYAVMISVAGKNLTLDLNGNTINVNYDSNELLYSVVYVADGASLTVNNSVDKGGINLITGETKAGNYKCVAYMFWKRGTTGKLVINGGNYQANDLEDSMVYTNGNRIVTVNGGSFVLDAIDTGANGSPWIFNAKGQNEQKVVVNGGSFNADVFHQHWIFEITSPKEKALQKDENGVYTVVDAVAYVNEQHWSGKWYTKNVGYATLEEAIAAVKSQQTSWNGQKSSKEVVTLLSDITLENTVVIPAGKTVVLNLDTYTIDGTATAEMLSLIENNGTLTINGNGAIEMTCTTEIPDKAVNAISNRGVLTVDGGKISNTGIGTQIGYGIDNYNGATLTVNGGEIVASDSGYYDGIRLFCGSKETVVTVNNGTISSIWAQNPSANKATEVKGTVVLNGGNVNATFYENYTTVKVASGLDADVIAYGAGSDNTTSTTVDGYNVYSFVH